MIINENRWNETKPVKDRSFFKLRKLPDKIHIHTHRITLFFHLTSIKLFYNEIEKNNIFKQKYVNLSSLVKCYCLSVWLFPPCFAVAAI